MPGCGKIMRFERGTSWEKPCWYIGKAQPIISNGVLVKYAFQAGFCQTSRLVQSGLFIDNLSGKTHISSLWLFRTFRICPRIGYRGVSPKSHGLSWFIIMSPLEYMGLSENKLPQKSSKIYWSNLVNHDFPSSWMAIVGVSELFRHTHMISHDMIWWLYDIPSISAFFMVKPPIFRHERCHNLSNLCTLILNNPPNGKHGDLFLLLRGILYLGAPNIPMNTLIIK